MPACRHRSLTGTPASPCLRIETIWVSLNFDFFMEPPGWKDARKLYFWGVRDQGELTQAPIPHLQAPLPPDRKARYVNPWQPRYQPTPTTAADACTEAYRRPRRFGQSRCTSAWTQQRRRSTHC